MIWAWLMLSVLRTLRVRNATRARYPSTWVPGSASQGARGWRLKTRQRLKCSWLRVSQDRTSPEGHLADNGLAEACDPDAQSQVPLGDFQAVPARHRAALALIANPACQS